MERKSLKELELLAAVESHPPGGARKLSKRQRMERWADILEHRGGDLQSLYGTEYARRSEREAMRADNSPLTVASEDPVLRAHGLMSDRLGEAMRFFGLSSREAHNILCYCHFGGAVRARTAARSVRDCLSTRRRMQLERYASLTGIAVAAALLAV